MISRLRSLPYTKKKQWYGFLFVLPWVIGFILFFAGPLITSFKYSFYNMELTPDGLKGSFAGWENFRYAIFRDPQFIREAVNSFVNMFYSVPLILIYSLFVAVLLKNKFRGRGLMRAISFLPVIIASGVLMQILKEDVFSQGLRGGAESVYLFSGAGINGILTELGIGPQLIEVFNNVIARIFDLTWRSGVQVLLFLAGLHAISGDLYEASAVEGARAWEQFWKITLPMLTPIMLLNVVYTIIDTFTDYGNGVILMIYNTAFSQVRFGYSSALAWLYLLGIALFLGALYALIKKRIVNLQD
ncbi:lactose ABC transporter permease [Paenibacillus darwinianus]|uniref:Lactose ABC transporter permease n=1 Tax=Paenibacillus darwinianus TaxID=1380763 RepID=A0A9W5W7A9_9BACL|nr:sugar ABC transporter permease [Paenibacillus darwinianus]EXX85335.1 lactose ABC transporter permease [Paenibacillus darwinianus]EXX87334.1 lactose ABC transporter permease [Paenibacillus darwinianus]EXX87478.1 lactose ABC transporter permease [Paenibacillus darwinianus]